MNLYNQKVIYDLMVVVQTVMSVRKDYSGPTRDR